MSSYVHEWRQDGDRFAVLSGESPEESVGLTFQGVEYARGLGRPLRLRIVLDQGRELPLSDFPYTGLPQPLVISDRAWRLLSDTLMSCGTVFPALVLGHSQEYWVWHPGLVADCLIEEESEIFESLSGYRQLVRPVFRRDRVPDESPFVVKGFERGGIWMRKRFATRLRSEGLDGAVISRRAVARLGSFS